MRKYYVNVILISAIISGLAYIVYDKYFVKKQIFMASISSDGKHVITTDQDHLVLWNIEQKSKKVISGESWLYSAYFIKDSFYFMWQSKDHRVHVRDIQGKHVKEFTLEYQVFGHIMTADLEHYISSDIDWNVYKGYGENKNKILDACAESGFLGRGKLLDLTFSQGGKYFTTAGDGSSHDKIPLSKGQCGLDAKRAGVPLKLFRNSSLMYGPILWDTITGKPLHKFPGHISKATATISPDGKTVVSACEQSRVFVWNAESGEQYFRLYGLSSGRFIPKTDKKIKDEDHVFFDKKGLIECPPDFYDPSGPQPDSALSIKYIDMEGHYLRFNIYTHYAILYSDKDPKPLKYFSLREEPQPVNEWYDRGQAIDTAPKANILVMARQNGHGIIVFKFDPKKLELKRIWVSNRHVF